MAPAPPIARNCLIILALIATVAALRWLSGIVTPLLLAIFLAIMVDGFGRVIRSRLPGLPRGGAILIAVVISSALLILSAFIVADNATTFIGNLAVYEPKLNALIARGATSLGVRGESIDQIMGQLDPTPYISFAVQALQGFASTGLLVLIYLGFILVSRHAFERKAVRLMAGREERSDALRLFLRIRDGVERYLWIQTVLGLVIAVASFAVMMVLGLDDAFFWAFLIFVVNYIPIIGAVAAIVLPALFALVQFELLSRPAILLAALFTITFVVGNIFLPRMQGKSLNLDPLVVLLSLAFWGAVWGLTGMFLSTPLTVLCMMILAQFEGSRWIAILLSADGEP